MTIKHLDISEIMSNSEEIIKGEDNLCTNQATADDSIIGHTRAIKAINVATSLNDPFYNVFAVGDMGIGKTTLIKKLLSEKAKGDEIPHDYIYVYDFENKDKPKYIKLEAGEGYSFKNDFDLAIESLEKLIEKALTNEQYKSKLKKFQASFQEKNNKNLQSVYKEAEKQSLQIVAMENGFNIIPLSADKKPISPEEFMKLSSKEQKEIENKIKPVQEKLEQYVDAIMEWEKEKINSVKEIEQQSIMEMSNMLFKDISEKWSKNKEIIAYINDVKEFIKKEYKSFITPAQNAMPFMGIMPNSDQEAHKLKVNVIIDNTKAKEEKRAPVKFVDFPTYSKLFGAIEYNSSLGGFSTNLSLVKPGAMHQANGGYLIIDAAKIIENIYVWDNLKFCLKTQKIQISGKNNTTNSTQIVGLEPEPIPLKIKVILIGNSYIYSALSTYDPEFRELFKITAEFSSSIDFNIDNSHLYCRIIRSCVEREKLLDLNKGAISKILSISQFISGERTQLTTRIGSILDIVREANYFALESNAKIINEEHIIKAFQEQKNRLSNMYQKLQESIIDGTVMIKTDGHEIGQINGLAVYQIYDHMFGLPSRISASIYAGDGNIVNIEKESKLSGKIHSKGFYILNSFLRKEFGKTKKINFSGSINFEQSYGGVDGDSASAAEFFALVSSLVEIPINQSFAVTGAIDQKGNVMAIGGINHKIEGFFDVCYAKNSKPCSVIMPKANLKNLIIVNPKMLEEIEKGNFKIYAISNVFEGLELLTGLEFGTKDKNGNYPKNSIGFKIQEAIDKFDTKKDEEKE